MLAPLLAAGRSLSARRTAAGVQAAPKTWAELVSLIGQLKRHGESPWVLAAADPWTLADWFENVYRRPAR